MGVSVSKEGPYFNGGVAPSNTTNMKFSQMRDVFKLDLKSSSASGGAATSQISANELRRNTNPDERNPYVPDCVINEDIAGSGQSNWKVSQMRNSVKRFWATQSGTDINFRMGRYNGSTGIDWGGYGASGRDSTSSSNGNLTKNVQKFIKIEGTCGANDSGSWGGENNDPGAGSWTPGAPAAQLRPSVPARNVRIWVYGSILGAGGEGGYDSRGYNAVNNVQNGADPGTPGGNALGIDHSGNNTEVVVKSGNARIYGGGGGGEQGRNGQIPRAGRCIRTWNTSGCGSYGSCAPGVVISSWQGSCCNEGEYCWGRFGWGGGQWCNEYCNAYTQNAQCEHDVESYVPVQGIGGRGGNGQGYNLSRSDGQNGTDPNPKAPWCDSGYNLNGGTPTTAGARGGNGGTWGSAGGSTSAENAQHQPNPSTGGAPGRAICGSNFTVAGTINSNTIKGSYSGQCDGSTTVPPCNAPSVSISNTGNGPFTINWNITGTTPITVTGSSSPSDSSWNPSSTSGSATVNPASGTTYSISGTNSCGASTGSTTIGVVQPVWTISRSASWQNQITFNRYEGSGQAQIIATNGSDGSTATQQITASGGAKYRMLHRTGNYNNGWKNANSGAVNLSENERTPVTKLMAAHMLRLEDGSNDVTHPDGRSWLDLRIDTSAGAFSVDGFSDWPLKINGLHSRNDSRDWIQTTGGIPWYKVSDPTNWGAWSAFMNEYAVYVSTNNASIGTHTYTGTVNIPTSGLYKLAFTCDNTCSVTFNGTTSTHNDYANVKTDDHNLNAGSHSITFSVTNEAASDNSWQANPGGIGIRLYRAADGANAWSTRDNVAGTSSGGTVTNDQVIEFWDGTNPDANVTFSIVSKESTISQAKFVDRGRHLQIVGGGNITMRMEWSDNPGDAGVALDSINIWDVIWTRSGTTGSQEITYATCGGDIIYTV